MPELPEVHTTATGLNSVLPSLTITDVWTSYGGAFHKGKSNIKDGEFFKKFKAHVVGKKVISASRRGKNVLINLAGSQNEKPHTILVHMKMTGHLLYGKYEKRTEKIGDRKSSKNNSDKEEWTAVDPGPLRDDPFNKWIRFVIELSNGKHVALSDMRKFAKVTLIETARLHESIDLKDVGPEPREKDFSFTTFKAQLMLRPKGKIKQVLMDQSLIAGIGNIYSDEMLWMANIHPLSAPVTVPEKILKKLYADMKKVLEKGIDFGGDSMSDYRNIHGLRGAFQHKHNAYQLTGERCRKAGCGGTIQRIKVGGRNGHFCGKHQKLFK